MTILTQTHKSHSHKPHSMWTRIKAAFARANQARRERAIALWCCDEAPAGGWHADASYRLMQRAYGSNGKG